MSLNRYAVAVAVVLAIVAVAIYWVSFEPISENFGGDTSKGVEDAPGGP